MTVFRSITTPNRVALPAPCDMGAPSVYTSWRGGQDRAMERLLASQKRFKVLALPTGVGKSLVAMVHAVFGDKRTVILTSTKGGSSSKHIKVIFLTGMIRAVSNR